MYKIEKHESYPNPLAPASEKKQPSYGISYFKKMYSDWKGNKSTLLERRATRYQKLRKYSRGLQPIQKYKNLMSSHGDNTFMNLDWSVVPIIPKFVDVIVGSLTNQDYKVICTAIDPVSTQKRYDDKMDIAVDIMATPFLKELSELSKIPLAPGTDTPQTDEELELYMELNYKQSTEIAMEEGIELAFSINDWNEVSKRVIRDLVDISMGSVKTYLDSNGIGIRYVDPQNLITSYTENPNFKDIVHAGEVRKISIQELKRLAGEQFSEEQYAEIANVYTGKNNNPSKFSKNILLDSGIESFEYDSYIVDLLDAEFKSVDSMHYERKENQYGGTTTNKKSSNYKPPKKSKFKREQVNPLIEMWYAGKWIIGTDYVFDYGLKKNMLRPKSNLAKTLGSYSIYAPDLSNMDNKSLVERMIPFTDQIQLVHLKMQQLIAKTKPKGMAIEIGSIEGVSKGDGGTFTALEVQDIYEQTGNLYYRMLDDSGEALNVRPIQELAGGAGQYLQELIMSYNYYLDRIRDVTGINEIRDGSTPAKDSLVGVQKLALLASNNATRGINDAYINIMEKVANTTALALQDLVKYKGPYKGYIDAIGDTSMKAISVTKDVYPIEVGLKIQAMPDEKEKEMLEQNIQQSIAQKELRLEDAIMIRGINNIKLANQMLILRRKKYIEEQQKIAEQNAQMNAQQQQQSAQMAAEQNAQIEQMKNQSDLEKLQAEYAMKEQFAQAEHQREIERIQLEGEIKSKHIEQAEDDSDLVRVQKGTSEGGSE
tara:strand:- start:2142 stop:4442 length:2301 start_codon:yes stop_codon:yes gene_type:complete